MLVTRLKLGRDIDMTDGLVARRQRPSSRTHSFVERRGTSDGQLYLVGQLVSAALALSWQRNHGTQREIRRLALDRSIVAGVHPDLHVGVEIPLLEPLLRLSILHDDLQDFQCLLAVPLVVQLGQAPVQRLGLVLVVVDQCHCIMTEMIIRLPQSRVHEHFVCTLEGVEHRFGVGLIARILIGMQEPRQRPVCVSYGRVADVPTGQVEHRIRICVMSGRGGGAACPDATRAGVQPGRAWLQELFENL